MPSPLGWPPILLDGAHNTHAFTALRHSLTSLGITPSAVIFSCLADKDPAEIVPLLRALCTGPIFVPPIPDNPRAMDPKTLAALIGPQAVPAASLQEALQLAAAYINEHRANVPLTEPLRTPPRADLALLPSSQTDSPLLVSPQPDSPLLVCGSLYLLGAFFALRPDCLKDSPLIIGH